MHNLINKKKVREFVLEYAGRSRAHRYTREKAQAVKKSGLLEIVEVRETLGDIGGLDCLKDWLIQRRDAFGEKAREYRLPSPKGVLLLGVPGTGKSLAGSQSSGSTDGGTSARVFGSLISWMQERTASVTIIATANDVTQLSAELLRKGRWDEIFWTDLPNRTEREAIWRIKIAQSGRDAANYVKRARMQIGLTQADLSKALGVGVLWLLTRKRY